MVSVENKIAFKRLKKMGIIRVSTKKYDSDHFFCTICDKGFNSKHHLFDKHKKLLEMVKIG